MLTRLDLRHFKCFERLQLPLGRLTLLSGTNASGKSSIMHALALLHQTIREHEWSTRLMLNGAAVRLGIAWDVIDQEHGRREFELGLVDGETQYLWEFRGERREMSMAVTYVNAGGEERRDPDALHRLMPGGLGGEVLADRLERLSYLTAERLGPREVYALEDPQMTPVVGPMGEYAVSLLHSGGDETVLPGLIVEDALPTRLHQVTKRMEQFFPGCGLDIRSIADANAVTLGLRTSKATRFHRPINTGVWVDPSVAAPGRCRFRRFGRYPPCRESRGASPSVGTGGNGRVPGGGRCRRGSGPGRDAQRSCPQWGTPRSQEGDTAARRCLASLLPASGGSG